MAKPIRKKLAFEEACKLNFDQRPVIQSPELKDIADVLFQNLEGVVWMTNIQPEILSIVMYWQYVSDKTSLRVLDDIIGFAPPVEELEERMGLSMEENFEQDCENIEPAELKMAGVNAIKHVSALDDDKVHLAFERLMQSQIVSSWTAFETMASDLWEKIVDIQSCFGPEFYEIIKSGVKHSTFDDMKKAYVALFPSHKVVLGSVFTSELSDLYQFRNVLVHAAGTADKKFVKAMNGKPYGKFQIGKKIFIDGNLSFKLVNVGMSKSLELITKVDGWVEARRQAGKSP